MRTAHKQHIKKFVCPICKQLISTMANMRVHIKREKKDNKKKYKLRNGKINGKAIERVWVSAKSLQNGRFHGTYTSDVDSTGDSSGSESENVPLAELFGLNTSSNNAMSADLTVSNSSMDHQMEEEPSLQMDQTNEGNSFVFIICRISINKIQL